MIIFSGCSHLLKKTKQIRHTLKKSGGLKKCEDIIDIQKFKEEMIKDREESLKERVRGFVWGLGFIVLSVLDLRRNSRVILLYRKNRKEFATGSMPTMTI